MAGIKVFATGGLGGVHRGVEKTMDVSADLTELGRTNIALVCAGSKAFLDLERTLEYLETEGVYVGTFGDRKSGTPVQYPAFYSRGCGIISPSVVADAKEAASIICMPPPVCYRARELNRHRRQPLPRSHLGPDLRQPYPDGIRDPQRGDPGDHQGGGCRRGGQVQRQGCNAVHPRRHPQAHAGPQHQGQPRPDPQQRRHGRKGGGRAGKAGRVRTFLWFLSGRTA